MCVLLGSWDQIAVLCITDVIEYIQEMREILHNLQNRIQKAKQNIEGIRQAMQVSELPRAGLWGQGTGARQRPPVGAPL